MAPSGAAFESLTEQVFRALLEQDKVQNLEVQRNVALAGRSTEHQCDVLWRFTAGGLRFTTVVECKDWHRPVQKSIVFALTGLLQDLREPARGVIVSRSGFQCGAISTAREQGVTLYELREPLDADWKGRVEQISLKLRIATPHFDDLLIEMKPGASGASLDSLTVNPLETKVVSSQGEVLESFADLRQRLGPPGFDVVVPYHVHLPLDPPVYLIQEGSDQKLGPVLALSATVSQTAVEELVEINSEADRLVGYVLKDVLSGSTSFIGHDLQPHHRDKAP